ncbi:hypothetical protein [Nannocystis radixulma]|uniref:Lipoprotein n=1 Tax=Nannocystis radixulma TaxID=2995305 RepID=A0ABT5BFP2_9BACT|nr:hypothetical protein [Nannocystis radixulma]MDC0672965.1 hypothetical protein [Nannocystis radixulma]
MGLFADRGLPFILVIGLGACDSGQPAPKAAPEPVKAVAPEPAKPPPPPPLEWAPYTDADGGLKIQLPGKPKVEVVNAGGFDFHDASVALPGRDVSVTWSDLPGADVEVGDTEGMLDGAIKGLTVQAGGSLVGAPKPVFVEHHPGRDFEVEALVDDQRMRFRVRLFVVHDRLFRIVVRTGGGEQFAETEKVLASFGLLPEFATRHTEVVKFDWKPFKAPDGSFTAKFPVAAPRVTTNKVDDLDVTTVVGSALLSYAVFVIAYYDLSPDDQKKKPEEVFPALIERGANVTNTKLVGTPEAAPLGKIAGQKFTLASNGGLMHIEGRAYVQGKRVYFVQAQRPTNSTVEQAEFDTFFTGFVPGKVK